MVDPLTRREYYGLSAIMLLALGLRIWGLNAPLWYDEILTLETHISLPWDEMMQTYSMNHHYLFSLQAKLMTVLFGETAWAVRLPAMLFGLGSIATVCWLARDLAGRKVALVTALLLAISFHHIWFSQNARGYTELAFWSSLGMIFFLHGLRAPSLKIWLGYGLCLALAVATHLTGAFFFFAQGLVWLVLAVRALPSKGMKNPLIILPALGYLLGSALALAFYAPILASVFEVAANVAQTSSADVMQEYQNPLWTIIEAVRTGIGAMGPLVGVIALGVLALVGLGSRELWASDKGKLFTITVGLHIVLTMVLLSALGMRIWPRFFFVDIGFLMLLIVLGVQALTQMFASLIKRVPRSPLFAISVLAMVLVSGALAARNYTAPKQNFAGAYGLVQAERQNADRVYAIGVAATVFNGYYDANWTPIEDSSQFETAIAQPGPAYFIVAFPARYFRVIPQMDDLAEDGSLQLVKRFPGTLGDGAVLVLRRD